MDLTGPNIGEKGAFLAGSRPDSYWDVVITHLPLALVSGAAVFLPLWVELKTLPLIPCTFWTFFEIPCPFCGFTRAIWAMARGEWMSALAGCPLSLPLYGLTALVFACNAVGLMLGVQLKWVRSCLKSRFLWWTGGTLLMANWLYRLLFHMR